MAQDGMGIPLWYRQRWALCDSRKGDKVIQTKQECGISDCPVVVVILVITVTSSSSHCLSSFVSCSLVFSDLTHIFLYFVLFFFFSLPLPLSFFLGHQVSAKLSRMVQRCQNPPPPEADPFPQNVAILMAILPVDFSLNALAQDLFFECFPTALPHPLG